MKRAPITLEQLRDTPAGQRADNAHLFDTPANSGGRKKSKYNAKKTDVDGVEFDSKREAKRYKQLRMLLKAGEIAFLARQVQFELNVGGSFSMVYIADFQYTIRATGAQVIEDCKGFRTAEYEKKKRLMKEIYGIEILET